MSSPAAIDALLRRYVSGEYFSRLINHPAPHRLRQPPELVYHALLHGVDRDSRSSCRRSITNRTSRTPSTPRHGAASLPFDCIIVDDGSEDGTVERATAFFESRRSPLVATGHDHPQSRAGLRDRLRQPGVHAGRHRDHRRSAGRHPDPRAGVRRAVPAGRAPRAHAVRGLGPVRPHVHVAAVERVPCARCSGGAAHESVGLCGKAIETPEVIDPHQGPDLPLRNGESRPVAGVQERSGTARLSRRASFLPGQRRPRLPSAAVRRRRATPALRADVALMRRWRWAPFAGREPA